MAYTLRSGITAGRISSEDHGEFEIEDGEVEVEEYRTARALVTRYSLEWPEGDPGPENGESTQSEQETAEPTESDEEVVGTGESEESPGEPHNVSETDLQPVLDQSVTDLREALESGEYDDQLDELEQAERESGDPRSTAIDVITDRKMEREE